MNDPMHRFGAWQVEEWRMIIFLNSELVQLSLILNMVDFLGSGLSLLALLPLPWIAIGLLLFSLSQFL